MRENEIIKNNARAYQLFFEHILLKYHPFAGSDMKHFRKMAAYEIKDFALDSYISPEALDDFIDSFTRKWKNFLQRKSEVAAESKHYSILTDNSTYYQRTTVLKLVSWANITRHKINIIDVSTDLGDDPLMLVMGFSMAELEELLQRNMIELKIYKLIKIIAKQLLPFVPDFRVDKLRKQTRGTKNILCIHEKPNAVALAGDTNNLIFTVANMGLVHPRLQQLCRYIFEFGFSVVEVIAPSPVYVYDKRGIETLKELSQYLSQYAQKLPINTSEIYSSKSERMGRPYYSNKKPVLNGLRPQYSIISLEGQKCIPPAVKFLIAALRNYVKDVPRDIVLLVGDQLKLIVAEVQREFSVSSTSPRDDETHVILTIGSLVDIHVVGELSPKQIARLMSEGTHYIAKPNRITVDRLQHHNNTRGVFLYYIDSETRGNLWALCNSDRACPIYSNITMDTLINLLAQRASITYDFALPNNSIPKMMTQTKYSLPKILDTQAAVERAIKRILDSQRGLLHKGSDQLITLVQSPYPEMYLRHLFYGFLKILAKLKVNTSDNLDHTSIPEDQIREIIQLFMQYEEYLIPKDLQAPSFRNGGLNKVIALWSGHKAGEAAISDNEVFCSYNVMIILLLFILWEELYSPQELANYVLKHLPKVPFDPNKIRFRRHPEVRETIEAEVANIPPIEILKKRLGRIGSYQEKNMMRTSTEILENALGEEFQKETRQNATFFCHVLSMVFIHFFTSNNHEARIYISNSDQTPKFFQRSILYSVELELVMASANTDVKFYIVQPDGSKIHFDFAEAMIKPRDENELANRESFLIIEQIPERLLREAQHSSKAVPITRIQEFINLWKIYVQKKRFEIEAALILMEIQYTQLRAQNEHAETCLQSIKSFLEEHRELYRRHRLAHSEIANMKKSFDNLLTIFDNCNSNVKRERKSQKLRFW